MASRARNGASDWTREQNRNRQLDVLDAMLAQGKIDQARRALPAMAGLVRTLEWDRARMAAAAPGLKLETIGVTPQGRHLIAGEWVAGEGTFALPFTLAGGAEARGGLGGTAGRSRPAPVRPARSRRSSWWPATW